MKQTTLRLRTSCGSHRVLFNVGLKPTTLSAVESGVATAQTISPKQCSHLFNFKSQKMNNIVHVNFFLVFFWWNGIQKINYFCQCQVYKVFKSWVFESSCLSRDENSDKNYKKHGWDETGTVFKKNIKRSPILTLINDYHKRNDFSNFEHDELMTKEIASW